MPPMGYEEVWEIQKKLVAARIDRLVDRDVLLGLEHPSVFTLGRRGGMGNLGVSRDFLEKAGVPVVQVERGGDITYHGPGQLVGYPIFDLREAGIRVVDFVAGLEEVMIWTAADWGVKAERNEVNRGVWVGPRKLGSVGVAVRHGVSFHGLALNVNTDLTYFSWINPCGLQGVGMTSMQREVGLEVPIEKVREAAVNHMQEIFGIVFENGEHVANLLNPG